MSKTQATVQTNIVCIVYFEKFDSRRITAEIVAFWKSHFRKNRQRTEWLQNDIEHYKVKGTPIPLWPFVFQITEVLVSRYGTTLNYLLTLVTSLRWQFRSEQFEGREAFWAPIWGPILTNFKREKKLKISKKTFCLKKIYIKPQAHSLGQPTTKIWTSERNPCNASERGKVTIPTTGAVDT